MATKYWVALQGTATVPTANTASNWNTAADGSGSSGVPATTDDCVFGHADTVAAQLGFAECNWDLTQVNSITVHEGYQYQTAVTSDTIQFDSLQREITHETDNFETLGFVVGMWITVTGSTSNDGSYHIAGLAENIITVSGSLTDEVKGASVSIVSESSIDMQASTCTINSLSLDGTIKNSTGSNKTLRFEGTPGTNNWYITNGDNAQVLNQDDLTYNFNSAQTISFDDGDYPQVTVTAAANLQWDYKAEPTSSSHKAVSFYSLNVSNSSATATGTLSDPRNDFKKVFKLLTTGFSYTPTRFDAGISTWHFKMSGNFGFPVTGSTTYGAGDGSFTAAWYNVVLDEPDSVGRICSIGAGRTLNVNSLTVESGAQFTGYSTKGGNTTSTVMCINRPTINGAWNFSQVAEGIYSSVVTDTYPFTPSHGTAGNIQFSDYGGKFLSDDKLTWTTSSSTLTVDGKLTVTGLIDPTGLVLSEVGGDPASTGAGEGTIWVKSTTPTTLYFTDSAGSDHQLGVGGGGGGSGTVTSVAVTGSDGIEVDSGSPITTSGTIALGVNKTNMLSHLNVEDGADVTDAANVTAAGALMDSEVTNLAQVKAFDSADYATAAQGTTADAALPKTGGQMTGNITMSGSQTVDGRDLSVDGAKLDGIETNADVTDATNVASAGAIMDSDFSDNGLMERTGSGTYTSNTSILQTEHLSLHYAVGWWTFAVIKGRDVVVGQRGQAQFYIQDKRSSRHRTTRIEAGHQFGRDGSNFLTLLGTSGYGNNLAYTQFRIKEGNTYDGAALQIYISNDQNDIDLHMMFNLGTGGGWTLLGTMLADSDTSGHDALLGNTTYSSPTYVDFATSMAVGVTLDIEEAGFVDSNDGGGIATTGGLAVDGSARISGTLRQSVTGSVLVADANGDLAAASNLADAVYVQAGSAGQDPYNIVDPANWLGAPPATIEEALNRLEMQVAILGGPIP